MYQKVSKNIYTENIKNGSKMVKMRKNPNFRKNHPIKEIGVWKVRYTSCDIGNIYILTLSNSESTKLFSNIMKNRGNISSI